MKNTLLTIAFILVAFYAQAQETKFGLTAGYSNINVKTKSDQVDYTTSVDEAGFYVGAIADFAFSEFFHLQPEVIYANAKEANLLSIPILAKGYVANSGFHILAGPQASIILDDTFGTINAFGVDLSVGAGYDITEHFFVDARYSFELTNRYKDGSLAETRGLDLKARVNTLNVGVGYKF